MFWKHNIALAATEFADILESIGLDAIPEGVGVRLYSEPRDEAEAERLAFCASIVILHAVRQGGGGGSERFFALGDFIVLACDVWKRGATCPDPLVAAATQAAVNLRLASGAAV